MGKTLLYLPDVRMEGLVFVAQFVFMKEELVQVHLAADGSAAQLQEAYSRLAKSFRKKYGDPVEDRQTTSDYGSRLSLDWLHGRLRTSLLTMTHKVPGLTSGGGSLYINYMIRVVGQR